MSRKATSRTLALCIRTVCVGIVIYVCGPFCTHAEGQQASDIAAFFRAGQTFITWAEADGAIGLHTI